MPQTIAGLLVDIGASTARLEKDLAKSRRDFQSWGNRMSGMARKIGLTIGVGLAARALVRFGKNTLDIADKTAKMSRSFGTSVEILSSFSHAADIAGTSIDSIGKSIGILSRNMLDASRGTGEAVREFDALGISVTDSDGNLKNSITVLGEVADKFSIMEDGAGKTATAMRIFGRSGAELVPLLNEGSAGISKLRVEAEELGLTFDTKTAYAAERVNDTFTRIKGAFTGVSRSILIEMIPTLENLSGLMYEAAKNTIELKYAASVLSTGLKLAVSSGLIVEAVFSSLGKVIAAVAASVMFAVEGDFTNAFRVLEFGAEDVVQKVTDTFSKLDKVWNDQAGTTDVIREKIIRNYGDITDEVAEDTREMKSAIESWGNSFSGTLAGMLFGAKTTFSSILQSFGQMLTQMAIQQRIVQPLLGAFGLTASANGNVFVGGKVAAFASGGIISQPTLFPMANGAGLAGEAGPEAIFPLTRTNDGRLGIEAPGSRNGGTTVQIFNNTQSTARTERSTGPDGRELIKVFIDAFNDNLNKGRFDKSFKTNYGLARRGA